MEEKKVSVAELEELCTCWVCFEPFVEPITLQCGHTLCKDCTIAVLKKTALCPFCRRPFAAPLPPVNRAVVALVERLRAARGGAAAAVDVDPDGLAATHAFPQRQDVSCEHFHKKNTFFTHLHTFAHIHTEHACEPSTRSTAPHSRTMRCQGPRKRFSRLCRDSLFNTNTATHLNNTTTAV